VLRQNILPVRQDLLYDVLYTLLRDCRQNLLWHDVLPPWRDVLWQQNVLRKGSDLHQRPVSSLEIGFRVVFRAAKPPAAFRQSLW
jgi:hypothetical protein